VAVQSPALLDAFDPDEVIVAERHGGSTGFVRPAGNELETWLSRRGFRSTACRSSTTRTSWAADRDAPPYCCRGTDRAGVREARSGAAPPRRAQRDPHRGNDEA
jgi:hypothetical protein